MVLLLHTFIMEFLRFLGQIQLDGHVIVQTELTAAALKKKSEAASKQYATTNDQHIDTLNRAKSAKAVEEDKYIDSVKKDYLTAYSYLEDALETYISTRIRP